MGYGGGQQGYQQGFRPQTGGMNTYMPRPGGMPQTGGLSTYQPRPGQPMLPGGGVETFPQRPGTPGFPTLPGNGQPEVFPQRPGAPYAPAPSIGQPNNPTAPSVMPGQQPFTG